MALKVEKGVLVSPGATGNQTVALADAGFGTVKALLVFGTYDTAVGDVDGHGIMCVGFGTYRGAVVQQHVTALLSEDAVGTSNTARVSSAAGILRGFSAAATPTLDFAATLVSLGDAQFVLDWADLPATASIRFHYVALGGADLTDACVVTFNAPSGVAPYNQDVLVAAGFGTPSLLLAIGGDGTTDADTAGSASLTFGMGKSDTEQGCTTYGENDAAGTMQVAVAQSARFLRLAAGAGFLRIEADLAARASWPTDGFRLVHQVDTGGSGLVGVLALKGPFTSVIGSGTAPTAAAPQTQDLAMGATPRGAIFSHNVLGPTGVFNATAADLGMIGLGATDGSNQGHSGTGQDDANTTSTAHRHHSESKVIRMFTPAAAGTLQSEADASFVGPVVRLTWPDTDLVGREYRHLLLGDAPASTIWTDEFERATLGENWELVGGTHTIIGSSDWGISDATAAISAWAYTLASGDQFSEVQLSSDFVASTSAAVFVRKQAGLAERYQFHYDTDGTAEIPEPHWQLKHDGIEPGVVFASAMTPGAPAAGDVLRIEARGQVISGFLNGVKIIEATHTALTTGRIGVAAAYGAGPVPRTEPVHERWTGGELFGGRPRPFSRSDAVHRRSRW